MPEVTMGATDAVQHACGETVPGSTYMSKLIEDTFATAARSNQNHLASELNTEFDYIVCGSGSAGSVVAGRLAAHPEVSVLLLEAGGSDETDLVMVSDSWPMNLGGENDWAFLTEPDPNLRGRSLLYSMGFDRRCSMPRNLQVCRGSQTPVDR